MNLKLRASKTLLSFAGKLLHKLVEGNYSQDLPYAKELVDQAVTRIEAALVITKHVKSSAKSSAKTSVRPKPVPMPVPRPVPRPVPMPVPYVGPTASPEDALNAANALNALGALNALNVTPGPKPVVSPVPDDLVNIIMGKLEH